ncbi:putative acetyl-CoA carboxylase [Gregarina niphandrodes]|uniref:Acetyl-CoA carboxylase n=1 Tax=Gregarina niphandrodes TaxID=110365 RepID=A0A023B0N9_GRENI|nr:putative acetyl-CoA carboxylase [Gregarina niphandrodes]EZG45537.1 putative acetyl-CoA carboxylase [Gregarina niphandrodes]|eukprot:XP_011132474.1 putative acetyl-CoA carboxylase [Gregarina niphandrodes]
MSPEIQPNCNPLRAYEKHRRRLYDCLDGYHITDAEIDRSVTAFFNLLIRCPLLPLAELRQCYSVFEKQLPVMMREAFTQGIASLEAALPRKNAAGGTNSYPSEGVGSTKSAKSTDYIHRHLDRNGVGFERSAYDKASSFDRPNYENTSCDPKTDPVRATELLRGADLIREVVRGTDSQVGQETKIRSAAGTISGATVGTKIKPIISSGTDNEIVILDEYCASFDEQLQQVVQDLHFTLSTCPEKPSFVEAVLVRFFHGQVVACLVEVQTMLQCYLEVEEMFHNSDLDVAGLVLHNKRPEMDPEQLLYCARSHQGLRAKNRLVLNLVKGLRAHFPLINNWEYLDMSIRRLSQLSKIPYSQVTDHARQLLLLRRDGPPFQERTRELIEALWDLMDSPSSNGAVVSHVPPSTPMSPTAFGGLYGYRLSPTPGSGGLFLPLSGGGHILNAPGSVCTTGSNHASGCNSTSLGLCALDLNRFPTESLVVALCHQNSEIQKLALQILVLRIYGVKPGKVNEFIVRAKSESWATDKADDRSAIRDVDECTSKDVQAENGLIAVWSHESLFNYDWLTANCDILKDDCCGADKEGYRPDSNGSLTSRVENGPDTNQRLSSRYVAAGSRLHHMLNAFGASAEAGESHGINGGRLQQTTAFLIHSPPPDKFVAEFRRCLTEIRELQSHMPDPPPSTDGKVLLCVVVDVSKPNTIDFRGALNSCTDLLSALQTNLVWVSYLCQENCFVEADTEPTSAFSDIGLYGQGSGVSSGIGTSAGVGSDFGGASGRLASGRLSNKTDLDDRLPAETPSLKFFYYRNVRELPYHRNMNSTADEEWEEEGILRNCEMPLFQYLELKRLSRFKCIKSTTNGNSHVHVIKGIPKNTNEQASRYFVRMIVNVAKPLTSEMGLFEQERVFVSGLNFLQMSLREAARPSTNNHILISVQYISDSILKSKKNRPAEEPNSVKLTPSMAEQIARDIYERYEKRLIKLHATTIEFRFKTRGVGQINREHGSPALTDGIYPYRIILENPSGQSLRCRRYVEIQNPSTGERVFAALDSGDALSTLILKSNPTSTAVNSSNNEDYDGKPIDTPHPWAGRLESKRSAAAALQTMYIYDFIDLLEVAVRNMWRRCPKYLLGTGEEDAHPGGEVEAGPTILVPDKVVEVIELALDKRGDLQEVLRPIGQNDCGMVAWKVLLRTPEFPKGRRLIIIGNDVTYAMGTFGVQEDLLFQRASQMSRQQGIPRIYIAVNSGARMGLAPEIQQTFRVEWIDPRNPKQGFKFIYLTDEDYKALPPDVVIAEPMEHASEGQIWRIVDVIGQQIGLGVENLCGSAAIAGETARAYKEAVTITYVTGRTVGIGAYLARLGHRVIQKENGAPILLTGFQALNRLIGRHVYTSNNEIGGPDVMFKNGVTHQVVRTDLEGCEAILDWLSFVPEHREGPLPVMIDPNDPISRRIEYQPSSLTDDPRFMMTGCVDANGRWLGGLLDKGSFREVMEGWARSVITGRGRLGGLPVGVILVETRVTETLIPADPAMPMSSEQRLTRAGQVWFPESAYKTAQAIYDFNKEEIPLLVVANWRGFSGGQRDMFHEVLKFGSMIVDALVEYRQPCLVYVPPKGELRGGAWVVVDPRINPDHMDMFAAPDSRGGVMQPNGTVEIKFRDKALRDAAIRSDSELRRITDAIALLTRAGVTSGDARLIQLEEQLGRRLEHIMPVMRQVAVHFADLHDTAIRMKRKKAITNIVSWESSRQVFYWRFRRQLILYNLRNEAIKHNPKLTIQQAQKLICDWAAESGHCSDNSQEFVQWACRSIQDLSRRLHALRQTYIRDRVVDLCKESLTAVVQGLKQVDKNSYDRLLSILQKINNDAVVDRKSDMNQEPTNADGQKAALDTITSAVSH